MLFFTPPLILPDGGGGPNWSGPNKKTRHVQEHNYKVLWILEPFCRVPENVFLGLRKLLLISLTYLRRAGAMV